METTTIAVNREIVKDIKEFGNKGESYSEIIARLVKSARQRQLHDILMNEEGYVPVKDALERAKAKWQK